MKSIYLVFILALAMIISCADGHHMPIVTGKKVSKGNLIGTQDSNVVTFKDVKVVFQKCTLCHVQGGAFPPDFLNYDVAFAKKDRLLDRVFVQKNMPLAPVTLTEGELSLLKKWLDAGALPESAPAAPAQPEPVPTPEVLPTPVATPEAAPTQEPLPTPLLELPPTNGTQFTYTKDIQPIFQNRCSLCHSEVSGLAVWTIYETAKAKADRLMERVVIRRDMPMGMPMEDIERSMIKVWLENGMTFE
jgi:uncharacterized membrane protein